MPEAAAPAWIAAFIAFEVAFFALAIGAFVFEIFCIVDIARRPDWQWKMTGSEKLLWLLLIILVNFLAIPSFIYWFSVRPKMVAVERDAKAGRLGPGWLTPSGWIPGPFLPAGPVPGWYPDPGGGGGLRYWDGTRWGAETAARPAGP